MKNLVLILSTLLFLTSLKIGKTDYEVWYYLGLSRRPIHFIDSVAVVQKGRVAYHLRIKDSITILCNVKFEGKTFEQGQYQLSPDTVEVLIQVAIRNYPNDFKDSVISEKVFKKHGNWIIHDLQYNVFYQYGNKLWGGILPVYIAPLNDFVYIDQPRTILEFAEATYIFESIPESDDLLVWQLNNEDSQWYHGHFKKQLNLKKEVTYKAYNYAHTQLIDSVFTFPVYLPADDWKKETK